MLQVICLTLNLDHAFLLGFVLFSHYIDAPNASKLLLWEKHFKNNINILAEDPCGVSELGFSYMVMDGIIPRFYKIVISMLERWYFIFPLWNLVLLENWLAMIKSNSALL